MGPGTFKKALHPRGPHGRFIRTTGAGRKAKPDKVYVHAKGLTVSAPGKFKPRSGRGEGISGLKKNTRPYIRVNQRSGTAGVNAGTIIPGTHKRVVFGGYTRIETTRGKKMSTRFIDRKVQALPKGSKLRKSITAVRNNVTVTNPAVRANINYKGHKAQARLGTSRHAGPTVIVKFGGEHRTSKAKSKSGVKKYDRRMRTISGERSKGVKKHRPQRRKAAAKRYRSKKRA